MGDRRIGIVTVGRSDRGHLSPLMALLPEHLLYEYRAASVSTPADVGHALGLATSNFSHQMSQRPCDVVVVFGDRWEQLAAASAAMILGIPIVHLHAGETTEAVIDDACRAAISALATIHVAAAEPYATRLALRHYGRVHILGAPGLARIGPRVPGLGKRIILVAFYPETRGGADVGAQARQLAIALAHQVAQHKALIYVSRPGMDAGRDAIVEALSPFPVSEVSDELWVKCLRAASVIVGNSSCGIIEAPTVPVPTVNIGDRQKGRLMASSIIQVPAESAAITEAIEIACLPSWQKTHLTGENPYGDRHAAERIAELLTTCAL